MSKQLKRTNGIIEVNGNADICGLSFHNVTIVTSVNKLTEALGEPKEGDGGFDDTVSHEWILKVSHNGREFVASVYDTDESRTTNPDDKIYFHIGGMVRDDDVITKEYLEKLLGDTTIKGMFKKKAYLVTIAPIVRVVVDTDTDEDDIIETALKKMLQDPKKYIIMDNFEGIREDTECPYSPETDGGLEFVPVVLCFSKDKYEDMAYKKSGNELYRLALEDFEKDLCGVDIYTLPEFCSELRQNPKLTEFYHIYYHYLPKEEADQWAK